MNYDLAMMVLEGLSRSPISIRIDGNEVRFEGSAEGFKELARLFLLLGGEGVENGESLELSPGIHIEKESPRVRMVLSNP